MQPFVKPSLDSLTQNLLTRKRRLLVVVQKLLKHVQEEPRTLSALFSSTQTDESKRSRKPFQKILNSSKHKSADKKVSKNKSVC